MPAASSPAASGLGRLRPYLRRYRLPIGLGIGCTVITNIFLLASPWVIKYAVDSLGQGVSRSELMGYAGAIIALSILQGVFRFGMRKLMIGVSRDIEYELRNDLFAHLERQPMRFYQVNRTGDLMSRMTNDLSNVRMLLGPGIMYTINTGLIAVIAIAMMLRISWQLTLISLLPMPLVSIGVRHFGRRIHDLTEQAQERLADLSARVQESLAGVRVVRAFVQETHEISLFNGLNLRLKDKNYEAIRVTAVFYPLMHLMIGLAMLAVLWSGGRLAVQGAISIGDFVAFTVYLGMLTWPMIAFGWVVNLLERGRASMGRLNYILDTQPAIQDAEDAVAGHAVAGRIEFRGLSFSHDGREVLKDIDLVIPEGRTLAVVGATGSGKTTLVQLIARLIEPPPETLWIDGVPVEKIPLDTLRRAIGFVPQDTFLFGESIRGNIGFGVESATTAQIEHAADISQVAPDIASFPDGYDTMIGERGITLSGGQKQRTAISRAVIRDPRILILDDALSSVDTYTEERILERLQHIMRGRTSILISHRVSTVQHADEVVVLDGGRIIERGKHADLIARGGYYADLHRRQLLEEELQQA